MKYRRFWRFLKRVGERVKKILARSLSFRDFLNIGGGKYCKLNCKIANDYVLIYTNFLYFNLDTETKNIFKKFKSILFYDFPASFKKSDTNKNQHYQTKYSIETWCNHFSAPKVAKQQQKKKCMSQLQRHYRDYREISLHVNFNLQQKDCSTLVF